MGCTSSMIGNEQSKQHENQQSDNSIMELRRIDPYNELYNEIYNIYSTNSDKMDKSININNQLSSTTLSFRRDAFNIHSKLNRLTHDLNSYKT